MKCTKCGSEIPDGNRFCGICGANIGAPEPKPIQAQIPPQIYMQATPPKKKTSPWLIAMLIVLALLFFTI